MVYCIDFLNLYDARQGLRDNALLTAGGAVVYFLTLLCADPTRKIMIYDLTNPFLMHYTDLRWKGSS